MLFVEGIIFTLIVPGTVTVVIPLMILQNFGIRIPELWGGLQYIALLIIGFGIVIYSWCLLDFIVRGRGIPLPIDHPKRLVVHGLYRYVRNPMYLGILFILMGEVCFFQSLRLFFYTTVWFMIIHAVVLLYEEPALKTKFGTEYEWYKRSVRRWLPGKP